MLNPLHLIETKILLVVKNSDQMPDELFRSVTLVSFYNERQMKEKLDQK